MKKKTKQKKNKQTKNKTRRIWQATHGFLLIFFVNKFSENVSSFTLIPLLKSYREMKIYTLKILFSDISQIYLFSVFTLTPHKKNNSLPQLVEFNLQVSILNL